MTSSNENEVNGKPKQTEISRNTQLIFHGMISSPFNLEGIKPAVNQFRDSLEHTNGQGILYMESPLFTHETAEKNKVIVRSHGFAEPLLRIILLSHGIRPTAKMLTRLKTVIEEKGLNSIEDGVVPLMKANEFFFAQELDSLKATHPFEVEYESHSPDTVEEISKLLKESGEIELKNLDLWQNGQISLIADRQKKQYQLMHQITALRWPDIIQDTARLTELASQGEKKGVIFIPFTELHRDVVRETRSNFSGNAPIDMSTTDVIDDQSSQVIIHNKLREGNPVPDELYVQNFFETLITETIHTHIENKGRVIGYMKNYEKLSKVISAIARSFSLTEIEKIAKEKKDILAILRVHPLSPPLLPFISTLVIPR